MTPRRPTLPARPGWQLRALGPYVGPTASAIGLLVVAAVSLGLLTGDLPLPGGGPNGDDGGPIRTPTPSDVVIVDPRTQVPGRIVYAKAGSIWIQAGGAARRLTSGSQDSMPSWSPDGQWIYFIRDVPADGRRTVDGVRRRYHLLIPTVMRMPPSGSLPPEAVLAGRYEKGTTSWSYFIRQPVVSPDLTRLAFVSDGPDASKSDVVVQFYDLATGTLSSAGLAENRPLGHQDPAWSPDGATLLYVKNGRDGARGAPTILRYAVASKKTSVLAGPGYLSPAWSADGRFVAATRTDSFGTDVVILDAATGIELLRVTTDGHSFSPVWSPVGDELAYLHIERGVVDLVLVHLAGTAPDWTLGELLPLTQAAGLDAGSRPGWYIPPEQLPKPTPSPTPVPTATPAASVAPAAAPSP